MGYSVVEILFQNLIRYDTDTILADGKVGIGDPMPPETDANLTIGDSMPSVPDPIRTIESNLEIS